MSNCSMCQDTGYTQDSVCGWCKDGVPHVSCDDTFHVDVRCEECDFHQTPFHQMTDRQKQAASQPLSQREHIRFVRLYAGL